MFEINMFKPIIIIYSFTYVQYSVKMIIMIKIIIMIIIIMIIIINNNNNK